MGGLRGETEPVGRACQPNPDWDGSYLPLRGESASRVAGTGLCAAPVASAANPSVSRAARVARQDGSVGCPDYCQGVVERGSTGWLCPKRTGGHLSGTRTPPHATLR